MKVGCFNEITAPSTDILDENLTSGIIMLLREATDYIYYYIF